MPGTLTPLPVTPGGEAGEIKQSGGRKTRGASVKQLKRMLKKAGLKSSGKKAALTRRAKKAHLKLVKKGGQAEDSTSGVVKKGDEKVEEPVEGAARRRRSRRSRGFRLF